MFGGGGNKQVIDHIGKMYYNLFNIQYFNNKVIYTKPFYNNNCF